MPQRITNKGLEKHIGEPVRIIAEEETYKGVLLKEDDRFKVFLDLETRNSIIESFVNQGNNICLYFSDKGKTSLQPRYFVYRN